jgi:hypothetical protein
MGGIHRLSILANVLVFIRREISPAKTLNKMHTIHLRWSAILPSLFTLIWMLIWNKTPQRELLAKAYHSGNPMVTKGGAAFSQHSTLEDLPKTITPPPSVTAQDIEINKMFAPNNLPLSLSPCFH